MKVTITWNTCQQTGPNDYEPYTEVLHIDPELTLQQVYDKLKLYFCKPVKINVQLHFDTQDSQTT